MAKNNNRSRTVGHSPVVPDTLQLKPVVRGWAGRFEVLTELGWFRLDALYRGDLLAGEVPFEGAPTPLGIFPPKQVVWGQWGVKPAFPRVASMNPVTGVVSFIRPTRFQFWRVEPGEKLVTVKTRGIDLAGSRYVDHWVLPRYGRGWRFVTGDDIVRAGRTGVVAQYRYLNKQSQDLYGWWNPADMGVLGEPVTLQRADGTLVNDVVSSTLTVDLEHPILTRAEKAASWLFTERWMDADVDGSVRVFNLHVPPFHNILIRRGRDSDDPRERWIGSPTVVGDGSDKSLLRHQQVKGAAAGVDYGVLRPDWKTLTTKGVSLSEQLTPDGVGWVSVEDDGLGFVFNPDTGEVEG